MYTWLATLTVAGILMASQALAATDSNRPTQSAQECTQLVQVTTETAKANDIGEKAQTEVDKLLVQLEEQCNTQQFEQADQTAALVRGIVATE